MIAQQSTAEAVAAVKRETESAQSHRLLDYLLGHDAPLTHEIARDCAISNISCAANRIRPTLHEYGLAIVATLPSPKIENRFGELSMSHEWRLVRVR